MASVTAADSTITIGGTATAPTVAVGTVPYVDISGAPTSLPPSGTAGGDLNGSYPNPTLKSTTNVNSIISANSTVAGALQTSGGTMSGNITMGSHKVTGLALGSASTDAVAYSQLVFVNPIDFGADPTGATDSTTAIQNALYSGKAIRFTPGTYVVSDPLYIPAGAYIEGTGSVSHTVYNVQPQPATIASIVYAAFSGGTLGAPGPGPLFVLQPGVNDVVIKNLHLNGKYTDSADNYAFYLPDIPGSSILFSYDTSQPWQAYNGQTWTNTSIASTTGQKGLFTAAVSAGATSITLSTPPTDTTYLQPGMPLVVVNTGGGIYETVHVSSYSAGVITLATPTVNSYASGGYVQPNWKSGADSALYMDNVSMYNFTGDATVYLGKDRIANKLRHVQIYAAGAGKSTNSNACGLIYCSTDSEITTSLIGAAQKHNVVLNSSLASMSGMDIWGAGTYGVYVLGGNRVSINNRCEFDTMGKEAIYIEASGTAQINNSAAGSTAYIKSSTGSTGASDVQVGPAATFSANCLSGSGTNTYTANIGITAGWSGKLSVLGTSAIYNQNLNGGVMYDVVITGSINSSFGLTYSRVKSPTTGSAAAPTLTSAASSGTSSLVLSSVTGLTVGQPLTIGSENAWIGSLNTGTKTITLVTAIGGSTPYTLTNTYAIGTTVNIASNLPYYGGPIYIGYSPSNVTNTGTGSSTKAQSSVDIVLVSDQSTMLWLRQFASPSGTANPMMYLQSGIQTATDTLMVNLKDSQSSNSFNTALYTQSLRFGYNNTNDTILSRSAAGSVTLSSNSGTSSGNLITGTLSAQYTGTAGRLIGSSAGSAPSGGTYARGDFSVDTTNNSLWIYNGTSWSQVSDPTKLPLSGGTMTAAIAMGSNKITGLANGTASTDAAAFGQIPVNFVNYTSFTSSTTWTVPTGVTKIRARVRAAGGGGGGGGSPANGSTAQVGGGGGGSGEVREEYLSVTPGNTLTVTVGTGGNGGNASAAGGAGGNGQGGNTSQLLLSGTTLLRAFGGAGGAGAAVGATAANGGIYGQSGASSGGNSSSSTIVPGSGGVSAANSGAAFQGGFGGGGGGGVSAGASTGALGGNAATDASNALAQRPAAQAGANTGSTSGATGTTATTPGCGGGGGGAGSWNAGTQGTGGAGGAGASGLIEIWY